MSLNVLYRPYSLDEMVGNEAGIESLRSKLKCDDIPRSYFFTGPPGTGKTSLAYVIKGELGISDFDFHEYDTANTRGIDTIRAIRTDVGKAPMSGDKSLYLLDECHQITGPAMEALLKMLEKPPSHVILVLCTSEPEKIKPNTLKAVRRRCFELELKALTRGKILKLLKEILEAEEAPDFPEAVLKKIASSCWGSPGQALSLLDAVIDMETEEDAIEAIENQVVSEESVKELCQLLLDTRTGGNGKWNQIRTMLPKISGDAETIRYAILAYLDAVILNSPMNIRVLELASNFTDSFMYTGRIGLTMACALCCNPGDQDDIPF